MHDAVDAQFAPVPNVRAGQQRRSGGDEDFVADPRTVQVGVWSHEDGVTDFERVVRAPSQQGMFHDDDLCPHVNRSQVSVEDRAVQDPRTWADGHVPSNDRRRGN